MMRIPKVKASSLSLYISIWMGLIVVGNLLGMTMLTADVMALLNDPITGSINLIISALQSPVFIALSVGLAIVGLVGLSTGGGFSVLYIIPLAIISFFLNLFILPTQLLMDANIPQPISFIYIVFIGALSLLTIVQFTSGRN